MQMKPPLSHSSQQLKRPMMVSLTQPQLPLGIKFPVLGLGSVKANKPSGDEDNPFACKLKLLFNSYECQSNIS